MTLVNLVCSIFLALVSMKLPVASSTVTTATTNEYGITYQKEEHRTYEWIIENFSEWRMENGESVHSPVFRMENNDVEWTLQLYPKGMNEQTLGCTAIFLCLQSRKVEKIKVHYKISILKSNCVHTNRTMDFIYERPIGHGWPKFISRSRLLALSSPNDTFTIRAEITMPMKIITESRNTTERMEQEILCNIENYRWNGHFTNLFKDPQFSDVVVVVDNERLPAHKIILISRSPVFATKLQCTDVQGITTSEVKIDNMLPNVMKAVLEFLYTDKVTNLELMVPDLLKAADRFELPRLGAMCDLVLCRTLNEDNAADFLMLVHPYASHKPLKEHIIKFIINHLAAVTATKSYAKMAQACPKLIKEILRTAASSNQNTEVCDS